jgi:Holliday junction resolvase
VLTCTSRLAIIMANPKTKGASGEREIASILNRVVSDVRMEFGLPQLNRLPFQRNQNQSAVGGSDLSNPFFLEIEIKRQETKRINVWWNQTLKSANDAGGIPILIYRANRMSWRVCMLGNIPLWKGRGNDFLVLREVPVELSFDSFKKWFRKYYRLWLSSYL